MLDRTIVDWDETHSGLVIENTMTTFVRVLDRSVRRHSRVLWQSFVTAGCAGAGYWPVQKGLKQESCGVSPGSGKDGPATPFGRSLMGVVAEDI